MKDLKTSLEPLQPLNLLYQYYLFIRDQQPVRKDQQPVREDQLSVPTLKMKTVSTPTSIVHKSGLYKTILYPDLYVLINDDHWTMTPETHKYAAEAGSFCFLLPKKEINRQLAICTTMPFVQRLLDLMSWSSKRVDGRTKDVLERCMASCGKAAGTRAKMRSRARKEASAKEIRGYYEQFADAKHLEYKSWVDNEVFDLIDMRKVKPKKYVTGRWVLTIKTDKQGNFLKAEARWVLRGFQDKQKDYQQTDSPASTRPRFRMSCQMAASKSWNIFHIDR